MSGKNWHSSVIPHLMWERIFERKFTNHYKIRKILTSKIAFFRGGKTRVSMIILKGVQKWKCGDFRAKCWKRLLCKGLRDLKIEKIKILLQKFTIILPTIIQRLFFMNRECNKSHECNYKNIHYNHNIHINWSLRSFNFLTFF